MQNILADITAQNWILALFIRDDGERFLLGTGAYEFKKSLQHFQPNTYANDVIELQGTDGQLLAGQVRRTASQPFDGYIADQTINQTETENRRRAFLMFFRKKHFYTVAYILPNGTAIQRRRGYITDAPAVAEMIQRWPEYHVALNFEDPNYYEYAEDEDGNPIYAHEVELAIAGDSVGGLLWDDDGVVWDGGIDWRTLQTVQGPFINLDNAIDMRAPLSSVELLGNTTQDTLSGKNLLGFPNKAQYTTNALTISVVDGLITINGTASALTFFDATTMFNFGTTTTNLTLNIIRVSGTWSAGIMGISSRDSTDTQIQYHQVAYNSSNLSTTKEYTATTLGNIANIKFYINKDSVLSNYKFYVQVVKGSTADSNYEPYCGGFPAPNPTYPITVQNTTWHQTVDILGKNMLKLGEPTASDRKGITVAANADTGELTFSGTTTNSWPWIIDTGRSMKYPAGTYAMSLDKTLPYNFSSRFYREDGSYTAGPAVVAGSTSGSATVNFAPVRVVVLYGAPSSSTVISSTTIKPMLELNDHATTFEPYKEQAREINLGKNMVNADGMELVPANGLTITHEADGSFTLNGTLTSNTNVRIDATDILSPMVGETLTISVHTSGTGGFRNFGIKNPNNTVGISNVMTNGGSSTGILGASTTGYVFDLFIRTNEGTNFSNFNVKVQCEVGSTATTWEKYQPLELCKLGDYQDKIYKSGDDWFVHKEVGKAKISDLTWAMQQIGSSSNYRIRTSDLASVIEPPASNDTPPDLLCSHYAPKTAGQTNTLNQGISVQSVGSTVLRGWVLFYDSNYHSSNSLSGWQSTDAYTNGIFYYALATATDTQITNQALIDQLDALASSTLFVGENNIALVPSGGAQGELKIIYPTDYALTGGAIWAIGGSGGGQNIITVDGVDSAFPVWEVVGPATNPILTNTTTGQSITWNGTVPNGQSLVVDMGEQTATMAGANVFQYIDGQWIRLDAGNNTLTYTATGATAPSILSWNGVVG